MKGYKKIIIALSIPAVLVLTLGIGYTHYFSVRVSVRAGFVAIDDHDVLPVDSVLARAALQIDELAERLVDRRRTLDKLNDLTKGLFEKSVRDHLVIRVPDETPAFVWMAVFHTAGLAGFRDLDWQPDDSKEAIPLLYAELADAGRPLELMVENPSDPPKKTAQKKATTELAVYVLERGFVVSATQPFFAPEPLATFVDEVGVLQDTLAMLRERITSGGGELNRVRVFVESHVPVSRLEKLLYQLKVQWPTLDVPIKTSPVIGVTRAFASYAGVRAAIDSASFLIAELAEPMTRYGQAIKRLSREVQLESSMQGTLWVEDSVRYVDLVRVAYTSGLHEISIENLLCGHLVVKLNTERFRMHHDAVISMDVDGLRVMPWPSTGVLPQKRKTTAPRTQPVKSPEEVRRLLSRLGNRGHDVVFAAEDSVDMASVMQILVHLRSFGHRITLAAYP